MNRTLFVSLIVFLLVVTELEGANLVTYFGNNASVNPGGIFRLSDGTFLVSGRATNLNWVPNGVPKTQMPAFSNLQESVSFIAFIAQFKSDFTQLIRVVHWPLGNIREVKYLKTNTLSTQTTGDLWISGEWGGSVSFSQDNRFEGYFMAKLNNNFINGVPTGVAYSFATYATGDHKNRQPWDVAPDGSIYYVSGEPYGTGWCAIYKLNSTGQRTTVEHWTYHEGVSEQSSFTPASKFAPTMPTVSAILFKPAGRCQLRSWNASEYNVWTPDGNGYIKKGRWPNDYFYSSHCDPANPTFTTPGYTGYRLGEGTARIGAVVVDKRNSDLYVGFNFKSVLPPGPSGSFPDFEPAILAYDSVGRLKWWSRLYNQTTQNSSPDQYVDGLAIDYSTDTLVALARCHGNNAINFWKGNQIAALPGASSFQNGFTGTNGDIHISWLGKLSLSDSTLRASTYVAEFLSGSNARGGFGSPLSEPNMDGWPNPNGGWPDVANTRCGEGHNHLQVDSNGAVYVICVGQRVITTATAHQKMFKPSQFNGYVGWSEFVRVYTSDFSTLVYSSLITGNGNATSTPGVGGDNTKLMGVVPLPSGGVAVVGFHGLNSAGFSKGLAVPTVNVPSWGQSQPNPNSETALLAKLEFSPTTPVNLITTTSVSGSSTTISSTTNSATSSQLTTSDGFTTNSDPASTTDSVTDSDTTNVVDPLSGASNLKTGTFLFLCYSLAFCL